MSLKGVVVITVVMALPLTVQAQERERIARTLPDGVGTVPDIVFATYGDRSFRLDLYEPTDRGSDLLPSVVVIRGGGWRAANKEGFGPMAAALAKRGLVAVSIEHRGSEEAPFPASVHDTKAAVRWLRTNSDQFGLDPDAIGAIGGSSGAYLATYLGLTPGVSAMEGPGGNPGVSSAVAAVVGLATPTDFADHENEAVTDRFDNVKRAHPDRVKGTHPLG